MSARNASTRAQLLVLGTSLVLALAVACSSPAPTTSGASSPPVNEVPPDLVPASAAQARVTVTVGGVDRAVPATVVARVVPFLVRRVFDAAEPLANYGLDVPRARVVFAPASGERIILLIGAQDFDRTAYYVQRVGDTRVWLVLTSSVDPLLQAG